MRTVTAWFVVVVLSFFNSTLLADPLPGENLVFQQQPMVQTNIFGQTFFGHDEVSTATDQLVLGPFTLYSGPFMADDFAVKSSDPITHVRWWGSYLGNRFGGNVRDFLVAFERDIPQGPNNLFSRPATPPILTQVVTLGALAPSSGTFTEKLIHPGGAPLNENLFEYNAELARPFVPTPNTVYWLKIVALTQPTLVEPNPLEPKFQWGWHNRDYTILDTLAPTAPAVVPGEFGTASPIPEQPIVWHFQDDAVSGAASIIDLLFPGPNRYDVGQTLLAPRNYIAGADGGPFIAEFSKDLAFELYAIPEPSTAVLAVTSIAVLALFLRYRWSK